VIARHAARRYAPSINYPNLAHSINADLKRYYENVSFMVRQFYSSYKEDTMKKKAFLAKDDEYFKKLGISKKPAAWEDGIRTTGGEGTFEWWYFDAEYSNGTKVVVMFYTKNKLDVRGVSNPTASIDITLPDGKKITKEFSEGQGQKIRASKEQCDVKIGQSSIQYVEGKYSVQFIDGDVEYTCTMEPNISMWRPATGYTFFGEQQEYHFSWFVAQPSATVRATLKAGGQTLTLEGSGYHDHNWGNIDMNVIFNHWYWCRASIGPYTIIASDCIAEKEYDYTAVPSFILAKGGVIVEDNEEKVSITRLDTEYHPVTGKFIDNHLIFSCRATDEAHYQIEFIRDHDIAAVNLLEHSGLSPSEISKARADGLNPTYVRCIGNAKLTVEKNGTKEVFTNEALWEQMFFGNNKDAIIGSNVAHP
jgi:hypothetical protein